jgi:MtN3 and saliva related transmembrane protein
MMILGIIGMALIVLAWVPQTIENIKNKSTGLNLKFILLYLFGSTGLLLYSILIKDFIFIILNAGAAIQALINLVIEVKE